MAGTSDEDFKNQVRDKLKEIDAEIKSVVEKDEIKVAGKYYKFVMPTAVTHTNLQEVSFQSADGTLNRATRKISEIERPKSKNIPKDATPLYHKLINGIFISLSKGICTQPSKDEINQFQDIRWTKWKINLKDWREQSNLGHLRPKEFVEFVQKEFRLLQLELNILDKVREGFITSEEGEGMEKIKIGGSHSLFEPSFVLSNPTGDGFFYFSFGKMISDLVEQNMNRKTEIFEFTTKLPHYASRLYNFLCDFMPPEFGKTVLTDFVFLESFLKYMACPVSAQKNFAEFKRTYLMPAIADINKDANIKVDFDEERDVKKVRKKVTHIRFRVALNEKNSNLFDQMPVYRIERSPQGVIVCEIEGVKVTAHEVLYFHAKKKGKNPGALMSTLTQKFKKDEIENFEGMVDEYKNTETKIITETKRLSQLFNDYCRKFPSYYCAVEHKNKAKNQIFKFESTMTSKNIQITIIDMSSDAKFKMEEEVNAIIRQMAVAKLLYGADIHLNLTLDKLLEAINDDKSGGKA